jgi:hypothetical protein
LIGLGTSSLELFGLAPFSLQVPAAGGAGIADGETFAIERNGAAVTFEFDQNGNANNTLTIPYLPTDTTEQIANKIVSAIEGQLGTLVLRPANLGGGLVFIGGDSNLNIGVANSTLTLSPEPLRQLILPLRLVVPAGGAAEIGDDEIVRLSDGLGGAVDYEFDLDSSGITLGTSLITLTGSESQSQVADLLVTAINSSLVTFPTLRASNNNGVVEVSGLDPGHTFDATGSPNFIVDRTLAAGETIVVDDGIRPPVVFEVSVNGSPIGPGNVAVDVPLNATADQVSDGILAALQSQQDNITGLSPAKPNAQTVTLAFHVNDKLDLSATSLTHAGRAPSVVQSPGAGLAVQVAPIAQLQLPADGSGLQDQDAFVLSDGINPPITFEFDSGGGFGDARRIPFAATSTVADLTAAVFAEVQAAIDAGELVGIALADLGNGLIDFNPSARIRLDASSAGGRIGQIGPVSDEDAFTIDDRTHTLLTFEFDSGGGLNTGGARPISFSPADSADDIAEAIVSALKNAVLDGDLNPLTPVNIGDGVVDIDADADLSLAITQSQAGAISSTGTPGGIADGQTFTLSDGTSVLTFEFDRNGKFVEQWIPVSYTGADDANALGAKIAAAINV